MAEALLLAGIGFLLCCLIVTLLALLVYSGLFASIEVGAGKPPIGEVVFAYKFHRGPYKDSGNICSEVSSISPPGYVYKALSVYYDDPKSVPEHECRCAVGAILSEDGSEINETFKEKLVAEGFKLLKFPSVSYAVKTTFPYKSTLSIFVAIFRVYPRLQTYIRERKLCAHPFLEIYDDDQMKFMAPLAKQADFYVDEAKDNMAGSLDQDDERDSSLLDDSTRESSVTHSEASCTTFMSSFAGDNVSDIDEEEEDDYSDKSSCVDKRDITPAVVDEKRAITLETQKEDSVVGHTRQMEDSGFTSEPTSLNISREDKEFIAKDKSDDVSDGNESGSSFEEIQFDPKQMAEETVASSDVKST